MRVISQDGVFDIPYEICSVWCRGSDVMCYMSGDNTHTVLATYSNAEKAKKAMEMLRFAYENNEFYHHTANSEHFVEICNMLSKESFKKTTSEYFQFPAEEELE